MSMFYVAGIVPEAPEAGGGFSVYFPDVPNVAAGGETVEEAIQNATSGLYSALRALAEANTVIPNPSALSDVRARVLAEREADGLPFPSETLFQYIPAPNMDGTPVRVNVTLPKGLLEDLDAAQARLGMSRSGLLAAASLDYLKRHP